MMWRGQKSYPYWDFDLQPVAIPTARGGILDFWYRFCKNKQNTEKSFRRSGGLSSNMKAIAIALQYCLVYDEQISAPCLETSTVLA
jgi:hypothetical protein